MIAIMSKFWLKKNLTKKIEMKLYKIDKEKSCDAWCKS